MDKTTSNFLRIGAEEHVHVVGSLDYVHSQKNQSGTAYTVNEGVSLLLRLPRALGTKNITMSVYDEAFREAVLESNGTWEERCGNYDVYSFKIKKGSLPVGLYFFDFKIEGYRTLYAYHKIGEVAFSTERNHGYFQLTVCDFKYAPPEDNFGGIIYHVFVDRFYKAGDINVRHDAVTVDNWYSEIPEYPLYPGAFLKNNTFFGGTLWGVIEKLDYLRSLGVSTIYLSPVFEAYSNHKYDTGDYSHVDEMFGGDEALKALIKEAGRRGMGIILDGVFNHTGSDSVYFNKDGRYGTVGAYQSQSSDYYSWYRFQKYPDKYTCWWGIEILPRIHPDEPSCSEFFIGKGGIIEKYSEMGINGFRLDVADELSDEFISGIKSALDNKNEKSILYGEVWEDASNKIAYDTRKKYYLGAELDGVMNYPVRRGIISYVKDKSIADLRYAILEVLPNMPKRIRDGAMNLLGTHDTERILTVLGGVSASGKTNSELKDLRMSKDEREVAIKRLKLAYTLIATLPGIPSIYYGDEAGLEGYSDPFNRRPYPWGMECEELVRHYRRIGKIRRSTRAYKDGEFKLLTLTEDLFIFERICGNERYVTVINNSKKDKSIVFDDKVTELISENDGWVFNVKSESALIFKSKSNNFITL